MLNKTFLSKRCVIKLYPTHIVCGCIYIAVQIIGINKAYHNRYLIKNITNILEEKWWRLFSINDVELKEALDSILEIK